MSLLGLKGKHVNICEDCLKAPAPLTGDTYIAILLEIYTYIRELVLVLACSSQETYFFLNHIVLLDVMFC